MVHYNSKPMLTFKQILTIISEETGIEEQVILSERRLMEVSDARCLFSVVAKRLTGMPDREISKYLNRKRTSIVASRKKFAILINQQQEPLFSWTNTVADRLAIKFD